MDYPPAPEIGDRERFSDSGQRDHPEHVEHRYSDRCGPDQVLNPDPPCPELSCGAPQHLAGGPQRAEHQRAPGDESDEEGDLPETTELDVGQALVAEPEPAGL